MAQRNPWDDDPVIPAGGPLASPPKPAPVPTVPSGYEPDGTGGLRPIRGGPADKPTGGEDAPSGYRWTPEGNLEGIEGGPAEHTRLGRALRQGDSDKLRAAVDQFANFTSLNDTFTDDFGGNWAGGIENTAQRYTPEVFGEVGTPGQAQWWASLASIDNMIRNDLFGASLTAGEKQAYAKTTVTPGMNPDQIRLNMETRETIMRGALSRYVNGLKAGGWNEQEVDALMGDVSQRVFPEQAAASEEPAPPPLGPFVNAGGQIAGNTHTGGDDNAQEIARGEARRTDNPVLAGIRGEYTKRLERGDSPEQLVAWARTAGIDASAEASIREQAAFRKAHPEIAIGEYDTSQLDDMTVPLTARERGAAEGVDNPVGAATVAAGDAFTGFSLDNIIGATGGNAERARLAMDEISTRHPVASTVGTLGGGVAAALGLEGTLATRGVAAGLPRALGADSVYGAMAGAGGTDYAADGTPATVADRFLGVGKGVAAAGAGSLIGNRAVMGLGRAANPSGGRLAELYEEGVRPSPGQRLANANDGRGLTGLAGRAVNATEEALQSVPIVGSAVRGTRDKARRQFQTGAFNQSLREIGDELPPNAQSGTSAHAHAQKKFNEVYDEARSGMMFRADDELASDLAGLTDDIGSLGPEAQGRLKAIMANRVNNRISEGGADGKNYKLMVSGLDRQIAKLRGDPQQSELADILTSVKFAIENAARRHSDPDAVRLLDAADAGYAKFVVIENASRRRGGEMGEFTPTQLDAAVQQTSGGVRSKAYLRGEALLQDYAKKGLSLSDRLPNSGSAERVMTGYAVGSPAAAGAVFMEPTTAAVLGTIATLYAPGIRRATTGAFAPSKGKRAAIARMLKKIERAGGVVGGATGAGLATQQ